MNHQHYTLQKLNLEIERTFFGKLTDMSVLKHAISATHIEQWEIRSDNAPEGAGGVIRVRAYDKRRYELCVKRFVKTTKGNTANVEKEVNIDKELFEQFKALAPMGNIKTRYVFEIPGKQNTWEVDVYENEKGGKIEWCKLDYETTNPTAELPDFPFEFQTIFEHFPKDSPLGKNSEKDTKMVDHLFTNIYNLTNDRGIGQIMLGEEVEWVDYEKAEDAAEKVTEGVAGVNTPEESATDTPAEGESQ